MKDKFTVSADEARDILDEDNDDFKTISDESYGQSRWSDLRTLVVERISDGKFFAAHYSCGKSESQEEAPWEFVETVDFNEVFKREKVVISYE